MTTTQAPPPDEHGGLPHWGLQSKKSRCAWTVCEARTGGGAVYVPVTHTSAAPAIKSATHAIFSTVVSATEVEHDIVHELQRGEGA